jgi:hypothetical protein
MVRMVFMLLVLLFIISCSVRLPKGTYGVSNPVPQTEITVTEFLANNGIKNQKILYFKDLKSFALAQELKYFEMPASLFYNSKGQFIDFAKCAVDEAQTQEQFSDNVNDLDQFKLKEKHQIDELLELIESEDLPNTSRAATTVVLTFGTWFGELNEDSFTRLKLLEAEKEKGADIQIYILSCDFLECWETGP